METKQIKLDQNGDMVNAKVVFYANGMDDQDAEIVERYHSIINSSDIPY